MVGMEKMTWEDGKGSGASPAKPLSSPNPMSNAQTGASSGMWVLAGNVKQTKRS